MRQAEEEARKFELEIERRQKAEVLFMFYIIITHVRTSFRYLLSFILISLSSFFRFIFTFYVFSTAFSRKKMTQEKKNRKSLNFLDS